MQAIINRINKDPFEEVKTLTEKELEEILVKAQDTFFNTGKPILSDAIYDILIDYMKFKYPKNKVSKNIGAKIKDKERKINLDYYLGSMDKIKPPSNELNRWKDKFKSPYVLTDKLDGISALLIYTESEIKLSTRGTATEGLNISNLVNYLDVPKLDEIKNNVKKLNLIGNKNIIAIRGELIISKKKFDKNWKSTMKNSRNAVSGLVNSKTINPDLAIDTDFIAYELVDPNHKILEQFNFLEKLNFNVVNYIKVKSMDYESLGKHLLKRRTESDYIIDGIVVYNNDLNTKNTSGNPKYAFAFKDVLEDQKATTEVLDVEWKVSKDGYINPTVIIKPVNIGGVNIERVTAHNAKYLLTNKLGKGAKIEIIRSGDVIPKIHKVLKESNNIINPEIPYKWNETKVDYIVKSLENNKDIDIKNIYYFFSKLDTKGLGEKIVERLYDSGLNSVVKILKATSEDFLKIDGFKEKSSNNLIESIKKSTTDVPLEIIFAASNKLGHGMGVERAKMILEVYPNILTDHKNWSKDEFIQKISDIPQFEDKTSRLFVGNFPKFLKFYNEIDKYISIRKVNQSKSSKVTKKNSFFVDKTFVFTGFRDSELKQKIIENGGSVKDSLNSKTDYLVVKDADSGSSKLTKAKELGVKIVTLDSLNSI